MDTAIVSMRASDAFAFAGRCCNYEKCPLRRFTRLSTGPALSLRMEGLAASDLRHFAMAQNRFTVQPLHGPQDEHRVVGTERTDKGQGAPFSGGLPPPKAHQSDSGEGTRPSLPTSPRAPPHGVPKGSARAGRAQRPRRRHSVWQRINARLRTRQAAANISNARSPLSLPPRPRTRRPAPRGPTKKNGPAAA